MTYSLSGAEAIRQSAIEKGAERKLSEMEFAEAVESIDAYQDDFTRSYWRLCGRVGKARANEIASTLVELPF